MLENQEILLLPAENNVFVIDWLTVVFHHVSVSFVQALLGMNNPDIPWETEKVFRNGYPMRTSYKHISILWGADDERFYSSDDKKSAAQKVRHDMGICLDMSGQGCREFENIEGNDWLKFFTSIQDRDFKTCVTRLDIAYDDHIGTLDISRIAQDVRDRHYTSPSRKSYIHWSDDQDEDIQGLTVEVGSRKSDVLVRIYDKAAERGFDHSRHWIRVELQLRHDRAAVALVEIVKQQHVGRTACGILRNYLLFRSPSGTDDNKSRWPVADYWDKVLLDMMKISLWISPGEPYNFSKTEMHMCLQYGQAFLAHIEINGGIGSFIDMCRRTYPVLNNKYRAVIDNHNALKQEARDAALKEAQERRERWNWGVLDERDGIAYWENVFGGGEDEEN